jgi:hypothetical protein
VSLEVSIPEVSELQYLSDIGSDQVRAMTTGIEGGIPEVEIVVTRRKYALSRQCIQFIMWTLTPNPPLK